MRYLVAPNPFKGTLTAAQAALAMAAGLRRALPSAKIQTLPLSDGGPGLVDCLSALRGAKRNTTGVSGPHGEWVYADWLMLPGKRAVLESAQVLGLGRRKPGPRAAAAASSFGLGQLIAAVAAAGAKQIVVGLGGTCTTDGGVGMAQALGWRLLDSQGFELEPGGIHLQNLAAIKRPLWSRLREVRVTVWCDVMNPLAGPKGAALLFARQKGATAAQAKQLDDGLKRLKRVAGKSDPAGSGAAGGLGYGLRVFAGARLLEGAVEVLNTLEFKRRLPWADWVLSGEGSLDRQSTQGKLPWRVALEAKKSGKQCLLAAGRVLPNRAWWNRSTGAHVVSIVDSKAAPAPAQRRSAALLAKRVYEFAKNRAS